ncbi:uncharacterized protein LOC122509173 [Leptopilina heterotoma]|uniref:uncharacterized protein LOC122509173 n=1 Tax=Leptopilina heterotoma TaxID=63436 RepID=UPI001CA91DB2|nr:uncharacterized protein LOC122509173 [Leptopilina heterotoma]
MDKRGEQRIQGSEQGPVSIPNLIPRVYICICIHCLRPVQHTPMAWNRLLFSGSNKAGSIMRRSGRGTTLTAAPTLVHCADDLKRCAFFLGITQKMSSLRSSRSLLGLLSLLTSDS